MKFILPKINIYTRKLSAFQERLWNAFVPRPYSERWDSDNYSFCHEAYGMKSERIKKYSFGMEPQGIQIHRAVSSFPYGNMAAAGAGGEVQKINSTITVGSIIYDSHATSAGSEDARLYGYKVASSNHPVVTFASSSGTAMSPATYTDGGGTSQTIVAIGWSDLGVTGTPASETDNIYFGLDGTSRGDDDGTFSKFDYNGTEYTRSSRTTYSPSEGTTETFWIWDNVTPNGPTSGTPVFDLWVI